MTDSTDNDAAASSLEWGTTSFAPGAHVGLVARGTIGLVARDNPSTRERLWALVSADASIDDILEELSSTGLKSLPDFAIAQVEGDDVRVVARGRASVSAESASGDTRNIDASDVRTWVEDVVSDVVAVTVSLADDEADSGEGGFAVLAGSVPAASMTRRFDEPDGFAASADGWSPTVAATPVVDDTDQAEPNLAAAPDVDLALAADESDDADDDSADSPEESAESSESSDPPPEPAADEAPDPQTEAAVEPEPSSEPEHDPFAPIDEAESSDPVLEPVESAPRPTLDPSGAELRPADPQPADPQPANPQPAHPQPPAPVITGAEAMGPGPSGPPPGAAPTQAPGRFDAQADLEQSLAAADESPAVGVLAFSNGERVGVDRTILIGRNPKVTGTVDGPLPYIMKYEGPGQGLSRTHAEVRIEDGQLVLEDLRSTNGTDVQLPGQQRRRLQGGEPIVVVPGTLIDFGEELHCTVETAH